MSAISSVNIDLDVKNILEHLMQEVTLNPDNPVSRIHDPYFQFEWGRPEGKFMKGRPIASAWPDGQTDIKVNVEDLERSYFIRLRLVAGGDDETSESLFFQFFGRAKSNFGGTSLNHEYQKPLSYTDPKGLRHTIPAPFKLGALGIQNTSVISTFGPRRLEEDHCNPLYVEMLIRWRLYLSVC